MFFSSWYRKLDLMLKRRDGALICKNMAFLCISLQILFLILLKYEQNNEIRTTKATATITVIINIEKKNEMTRKVSVEIKRFIKE